MKDEAGDSLNAPTKKPRFVPKIPNRKAQPKPSVPKVEQAETKEDVVDKELLAKLNNAMEQDSFGRRIPKKDFKGAPVQVAFGQGGSRLARTFGKSRSKKEDGSETSEVKEYVEPWDYEHTYYPVSLPLRRPYSGDPEILNEQEFGEDSTSSTLDETAINPAWELGLMEPNTEPQMLLFQFPSALPLEKEEPFKAVDIKGSDNRPGNKPAGNQSGVRPGNTSKKGCTMKDLPAGFMGKLVVYKSGKVKMKLGDTLFDVSPGMNGIFAQDVAVTNVKEKHCCVLGNLNKRAVVTPDVDSLLDSVGSMSI